MKISATEEQIALVKELRDLEHVRIGNFNNNDLAKIPNETGKARIIYEYDNIADGVDGVMEDEVNLISKDDKVTKAAIDMRGRPIAEQQQMQALLKRNGIEGVFDPYEAGVIHIKNVENASKLANMERVCAGNPLLPGTYWRTDALGLTPLGVDSDAVPLSVEMMLSQEAAQYSPYERLKPFYDDKRINLMDIGMKGGKQAFEGVIDVSEYPTELQTRLVRELRNTNPSGNVQFVPDEPGKIKMQGTLEDFGLPRDMSLEEVEKINKPSDKEWLKDAFKKHHAIPVEEAEGLPRLTVLDNSAENNLAAMIRNGQIRLEETTIHINNPNGSITEKKGYRFTLTSGQQNKEIASWLNMTLEEKGVANTGIFKTSDNKVIEMIRSKEADQLYKETFNIFDNEYRGNINSAGKVIGSAAEVAGSDMEKLLIELDKSNRIEKVRGVTPDGKRTGKAYHIDMSGCTRQERINLADFLYDNGIDVRMSMTKKGKWTIEKGAQFEKLLNELKNPGFAAEAAKVANVNEAVEVLNSALHGTGNATASEVEKLLINLNQNKLIKKINATTPDGKRTGKAYRIILDDYPSEKMGEIANYLNKRGCRVRLSSQPGRLIAENAKEMEEVLTALSKLEEAGSVTNAAEGAGLTKRLGKLESVAKGGTVALDATAVNAPNATAASKGSSLTKRLQNAENLGREALRAVARAFETLRAGVVRKISGR